MVAESGRTFPTMGKASRHKKARTIRMVVIPEPEAGTRSVLKRTGEGTVVFQGQGSTKMVCGKCGAVLVTGMRVDQIRNVVLTCNNCGSYNETLVT